MKHFWINMDNSIERRKFMEYQFMDKSISNIRITATIPSKLSDFNIKLSEEASSSKPEEISCIISHILAIKKGYDEGSDYFCVIEDDIVTEKIDFKKIISYIKNEDNKNNEKIELLQLYTNSQPCVIKLFNNYFSNNNIVVKSDISYPSTGYYLISRNGAKKILDKYFSINNNIISIDLSRKEWCVADNIIYLTVNTYILTYPIVYTNIDLGSTIHPDHLLNHEKCNIVIRDIWKKSNFLYLFF